MSKRAFSTGKLVRLAVLVAILLVMVYTPLGYLKAGPVSITFLMIPVAIASVISGPAAGALLGGIFGLTSFAQCFGADPFGAALLAINPVLTFVMCVVPRILAGWLPGLIFRALSRTSANKRASSFITRFRAAAASYIAGFCASALNTILFVGALVLFFGNTDVVRQLGSTTWLVIGVLVTSNALIEAVACTIITGVVGRALLRYLSINRSSASL